jgi:protein-S-isoprenylcysteine O-methyltransferase Ste14
MQVAHQKIQNLLATGLILLAGWAFYGGIPYYRRMFDEHSTLFTGWEISHWHVLEYAMLAYGLLLLVFYLTEKAPRESKSVWCLRALRRLLASPGGILRTGWPREERLGLLTLLLKFFFAPLMVVWLFQHVALMVNNGVAIAQLYRYAEPRFLDVFNGQGFWFLFQLILFLDVFFYTIGYLVELPALRNEIRSVDPTWLGWAVALACYPPINGLTGQVLGWHSTEFPQFGHPLVHLAANLFLLLLMAVYSWASVALNLRASNLTHRGIISNGPYRLIRHPAYVCKNLAWWIGLLPALSAALHTSVAASATVLGSMAGWSFIYCLRALTEERHLRSVDAAYDHYCAQVRYRFIPGVI